MIRFFVGHRTAANLLMLAIIVFGIANFKSLRRETFPNVPLDIVTVSIIYRGAAAENIALTICQRVEDAVDTVADLKEIRCEAVEGRANIELEMSPAGNIDTFLNDIKTEVDAIDDFPAEVETPIVRIFGRNEFLAAIAVTGDMSVVDLKYYAEQLKRRLRSVSHITNVEIDGFGDRQIRIEIPVEALERHGLNIDDISAVVARQNLDRPLGEIKSEERTFLLRLTEERRSPLEISKLIVLTADIGAEIRLGDIARIEERFEHTEKKIVFDGRRAAVIRIFKGRDNDTIDAIDEVRGFLEAEQQRAAQGVTLALTQDVSTIVRDRLNMLMENAWQGIILVSLALWLFFASRVAFWVALGLPVSFLGALGVMSLLGLSIDMLTMVGLLISIGLLLDDAIVIAENIAAERQNGKTAGQAALDGVRQVAPGVFASFITTVSVFGSLTFIDGDIGNTLKFVPIVLIITLSVSLIEAFLILPNHISHVSGNISGGRLQRVIGTIMGWLTEQIVGRFTDFALRWRYLVLGVTVALLPLSLAIVAGGLLKFEAFPHLEGDVVEARVLLPQGTPLARTEAVVNHLIADLRAVEKTLNEREKEEQGLVRHISVQFARNVDAFETGENVATITVDLLSAKSRHSTVDEILTRWRVAAQDIPDVININFSDFQPNIAGRPIEFQLSGLSPDDLKQPGASLINELNQYDGVFDVSDDLRPGKPELRLQLRTGTRVLGLDAQALGDQLATAFLGKKIADIQVGGKATEIDIRLASSDGDSIGDLESFPVRLPDGKVVPLITLASIEQGRGWTRLNRVNSLSTLTITGEIDRSRGNVAEVNRDLENQFLPALVARYPGLNVAIEGETKSASETQASVVRAFIIGLICVYLLLSFQFRSYALPVVIMLIIPLALIGVIWGHYSLGFDLSMPSILGFVALAGIVVNNAILLIEFTKQGISEGMSIETAAGTASRRRFRAMFLCTLTTVLGLLPLLLETSRQAQVLQPLVISLVFGLLATSILILFVVPAVLAAMHDLGFVIRND